MGQSFLVLFMSGNFGLSLVHHKIKYWILLFFTNEYGFFCFSRQITGLDCKLCFLCSSSNLKLNFFVWSSCFAPALCMRTYSGINQSYEKAGFGMPSLVFSFPRKELPSLHPTLLIAAVDQPSVLWISRPETLLFPCHPTPHTQLTSTVLKLKTVKTGNSKQFSSSECGHLIQIFLLLITLWGFQTAAF